jgi:hypothetical protein
MLAYYQRWRLHLGLIMPYHCFRLPGNSVIEIEYAEKRAIIERVDRQRSSVASGP